MGKWTALAGACAAALSVASAASATPTFTPLGFAPGDVAGYAWGISGDGTTVVGTSWMFGFDNHAWYWTQAEGLVPIEGPTPENPLGAIAEAASTNGAVIVGQDDNFDGAFQWTQLGGVESVWTGAGGGAALGVSGDGLTIVGFRSDIEPPYIKEYAHSNSFPLPSLPGQTNTPGEKASAWATDFDGSLVVGRSKDAAAGLLRAVMWTAGGGVIALDTSGQESGAYAVTPDGAWIVGNVGWDVVRWSPGGVPDVLGYPTGDGLPANLQGGCVPWGVSADGDTIVGRCSLLGFEYAFIWTAAGGMRTMAGYLTDLGLVLPAGYSGALRWATGISDDGLKIVGHGSGPGGSEGWLIALPEPSRWLLLTSGLATLMLLGRLR